MKILVTGGTGFIGSHTVVELQQKGHEAFIIDNLSNSSEAFVDRIGRITGKKPEFRKLDLRDRAGLSRIFDQHPGFDGVIHFAALKAVGESVQKPLLYYDNNLVGLINLLAVMQEHGTTHFVFSSSCTVYGQPDRLPVTEETPLKPAASPYGATKQICEEIIRDTVASQPGFKAIALRYFNPVGAHPSAIIGEMPNGVPNNLLPFITQTAAGKRPFLRVFGNDYNTPDGTAIRDYIHVTDLAKAHIAALDRMERIPEALPYEIFNVGAGKGYSVLEVIQSFERVSGRRLNWEFAPRRAGDVEQIYADASLANHAFGWKTESSLDDMTRSAWEWEQSLI